MTKKLKTLFIKVQLKHKKLRNIYVNLVNKFVKKNTKK